MKRVNIVILAGIILMSSVTPKSINASDNSAHRIERPTFVPGDYWISENWRDSNETKERNKIIFLKEEGGYFLFDNGKGETLYTDFNLTPMKKTRGKTNEVIWEKGFFEYPGPVLNNKQVNPRLCRGTRKV